VFFSAGFIFSVKTRLAIREVEYSNSSPLQLLLATLDWMWYFVVTQLRRTFTAQRTPETRRMRLRPFSWSTLNCRRRRRRRSDAISDCMKRPSRRHRRQFMPAARPVSLSGRRAPMMPGGRRRKPEGSRASDWAMGSQRDRPVNRPCRRRGRQWSRLDAFYSIEKSRSLCRHISSYRITENELQKLRREYRTQVIHGICEIGEIVKKKIILNMI